MQTGGISYRAAQPEPNLLRFKVSDSSRRVLFILDWKMTTAVVSPFFDFSEVINNKVGKKFLLDLFVLWNVDD